MQIQSSQKYWKPMVRHMLAKRYSDFLETAVTFIPRWSAGYGLR